MEKPVEKIVLLCGGKGTRLWPLTENIPKSLVSLNGKPVLEYLMNLFAKQGFKEFILCTGYKSEMIENEVKSFSKKDWKVDFVNSGEEATILKRIRDASKHVFSRFIVCYGDTVADVDIKNLIDFHKKNTALVTNVLYQMESPFGLMESKNGLVVSYKEKPLLPFWFNIGFFVFEKQAIYDVLDDDWISFLNKLVLEKKLFALEHRGEHITFNTEKERADAERKISSFNHVFERD
ncbi:MAG: nucleotidyltransferase family protein [Candidatus Diapherotrites archaeon]|nr:nucleotidyltransferase family protein [Candidatus Diapherotrites archaeon]